MNESRRQILLDTPHTETATGAIASFETDMVGRAKEVRVEIEAVQDLHGYENPWPAGGGVNRLDIATASIAKPAWYTAGWYGITKNANAGITQERGYTNGGAGGFTVALKPGETYTVSWTYNKSIDDSCKFHVSSYNGTELTIIANNVTVTSNTTRFSASFTVPSDSVEVAIRPTSFGTTQSGQTYDLDYIQIELGSSATAYEPYSNICPITGWNGVAVEVNGKNFAEIKPFSEWVKKYAYSTLDTKLPPNIRAYLTLTDKDTSVDVNGVSLGFIDSSYTGATTLNNSQFRWVMQNGRINSNRSNIPNDGDSSVYLNSLFIYPSTEDAYNKLVSRYNIMVELSPTATAYEPYTGSTTPISWADEAGTVYGGYLEWLWDGTVRLTVDRAGVDMGSLTWTYVAADTCFYTALAGKKDGAAGVLCSCYKTGGNTGYSTPDYTVGYSTNTALVKRVFVSDPNYADAASFKAGVAGNILSYRLATPVTYPLTPQEALVFLRGTNNVWNDINDTTVTYWTHKTGDSV